VAHVLVDADHLCSRKVLVDISIVHNVGNQCIGVTTHICGEEGRI